MKNAESTIAALYNCFLVEENNLSAKALLFSSLLLSLFGRASTPDQTQTGLGPRIYPFTTPGCCTAWIRCWQ